MFYLTKFGAHIGKTKYIFNARLLNAHNVESNTTVALNLEIYLDEKWDHLQEVNECQRSDKANVNVPMDISVSNQFTRDGNLA
jgi:hypothetical protein